ncbi:MAG: TlyA family RNA methyltransferase [Verrucomicrobiota bacterium]
MPRLPHPSIQTPLPSLSMVKIRLDQLLVKRGLCDSREQAKRLILAGEVICSSLPSLKPGLNVSEDLDLTLKAKPRYVGRGGLKLEGALDHFPVSVKGKICLDIGSSTGGFTDCLLQNEAKKVYAFDVGTNQLAWKLREDPRVISREQFNCRNLTREDVEESVDLIVMDVSFISLTQLLQAAFATLQPDGDVICLIKPQFEVTRGQVGKGGIVRDETARQRAADKIRHHVTQELNKSWHGLMDSPISGTDGNQEFLAWLRHE